MKASDPLWDPAWQESFGEKTIQAREASESKLTLYCSFFCPFAQRAWIAMEEIGAPYRYVEVNPYEVDGTQPGGYTKKALSLAAKKDLMPDFIAASPRGLVPALVDENGSKVFESSVILEYLDEVYGPSKLMPKDPHARALVRIFVDHCTSRIQKTYYTWLFEQDPEAQKKAQAEFFQECRALAVAMAPIDKPIVDDAHKRMDLSSVLEIASQVHSKSKSRGPYFLGNDLSAVDIALAPFWQRFLWVGGHYRGLTFPENDPAFDRLQQWWEAVSVRPSIQATLVCKERLVATYADYANNVGTSDFAVGIQSSLSRK